MLQPLLIIVGCAAAAAGVTLLRARSLQARGLPAAAVRRAALQAAIFAGGGAAIGILLVRLLARA